MAELVYLSLWEDQNEVDKRQQDFRNMVFAGDLWPPEWGTQSLQNYKEIFKEDLEPELVTDDDVEWLVPESRNEIEEIMAALAGRAPGSQELVEEHRV